MKFLLVAFFYPPAQSVASERWSRLSNELRAQNHRVTVWTGPWSSLGTEEGKSSDTVFISDPFSEDASRLTSSSGKEFTSKSVLRRWAQKVSPGFLLIDGKWFWSLKVFFRILLSPKLKDRYDFLIVSGTPWSSVVWVTLAAKLRGVPTIVDFRDAWAQEDTIRYRGELARRYFSILEAWVVRNARLVITVADGIATQLKRHLSSQTVLILESGFAGALDWTQESFNALADREPCILYAGSVGNYHGTAGFLDAARANLPPGLRMRFLGTDYMGIVNRYDFCIHEPPVPSKEAEIRIRQAGVLLMIAAPEKTGIVFGGKMMTYLKCGRPILYFGPHQSPAAEVIQKNHLGWVVDSSEPDSLRSVLRAIQEHFETRAPFSFNPDLSNLERYSAKNIVRRFTEALE